MRHLECSIERDDGPLRNCRIFPQLCLTNDTMSDLWKKSFLLYVLVVFPFSQFTSSSLPYKSGCFSLSPLGREYCPHGFFWISAGVIELRLIPMILLTRRPLPPFFASREVIFASLSV